MHTMHTLLAELTEKSSLATLAGLEIACNNGKYSLNGVSTSAKIVSILLEQDAKDRNRHDAKKAKAAEKANAAAKARKSTARTTDLSFDELAQFGEQVKVTIAAQLFNLSPVRIRRLAQHGKLEYGDRGYVTTASLRNLLAERGTAIDDEFDGEAE